MTLDEACSLIAGHIDEIRGYFVPGAKVTILIRNPAVADSDIIITQDKMVDIKIAIEELDKREKSLQYHPAKKG